MLLKYSFAGVPTSTTELPARELVMVNCQSRCNIFYVYRLSGHGGYGNSRGGAQ